MPQPASSKASSSAAQEQKQLGCKEFARAAWRAWPRPQHWQGLVREKHCEYMLPRFGMSLQGISSRDFHNGSDVHLMRHARKLLAELLHMLHMHTGTQMAIQLQEHGNCSTQHMPAAAAYNRSSADHASIACCLHVLFCLQDLWGHELSSQADFDAVVAGLPADKMLVVDYYAPWCAVCKVGVGACTAAAADKYLVK